MSITFSIESIPTGNFVIKCYDAEEGCVVVGEADSRAGILVERAAHMLVCEECRHYGCYPEAVMDVSSDLDVNLANTNARMILRALGVEVSSDLCGSMGAETFLGAAMLAMAADRDDTGVRPVVTGGVDFDGTRISTGATMVDCGLPAGYFADRFGALHALATEAVRLGRPVVWC